MKRKILRIDAPPGSEIVIRIPPESAPPDRVLSSCEADVLEFLGDGPRNRAEIVSELASGTNPHGESTVDKALSRLLREGRVVKAKTGYALPPKP